MLETPHVVVGAAIAYKVANPALALPLAFGSHFVLDKIPHWNPHTYTETQKYGKPTRRSTKIAIVDAVTALIVGFLIASFALPNANTAILIIAASFISVIPDVSKFPFYYMGKRDGLMKKWVDFERSLQVDAESPLVGILTQLIIIAVAFFWILA